MHARAAQLGASLNAGQDGDEWLVDVRLGPRRTRSPVRTALRPVALPELRQREHPSARSRPRVVLVDDQELVRSGLRRILRRRDGFEIVAECADGAEVPRTLAGLAARRRPGVDVVLMDLRMRQVDGITATRRLAADPDAPPVLVLTTFDDDEMLSGALRAGAAGFLLKDSSADDLIRGVRAVAAGRLAGSTRPSPAGC